MPENLEQLAGKIVDSLFADLPIPDELIWIAALSIVQSAPDLKTGSPDEMSLIFDSLCAALLARNAAQSEGVN